MKEPRLVQDYLRDMLDSMAKAEVFIEAMDYSSFHRDDKTVFAVIRALEIIGEAAKKIPDSFRRQFPIIPWKNLSGMRDKLIHDYVGVSLEVVWRTVTEDIPSVKPALTDMLEQVQIEEDRRSPKT